MADELRARRPVPAEQLARELLDIADVADIADELGMSAEAILDVADTAFESLDSTRWSLADYVLRGERSRRMINVPNPLVAAIVADYRDQVLAQAARDLWTRAEELAEFVRRTNTVVARWLVAHRVAVTNPCYLDSNALLNRYRRGDLDPASISEDPLYLLVCHLQDVLAAAAEWDDPDARELQHVRAQLTLPLRAVQEEMVASIAHHDAAVGLARAVTRLQST